MPDWYPTIRAAKYLGVAPWDLEAQPRQWTSWALMAEDAATRARKQLEDIQRQKSAQAMGR